MSELALGTVQFGLNYGVTNTGGVIDDSTMNLMLNLAEERGIGIFDTASDYGDAQFRIGRTRKSQNIPKYISKFSMTCENSEPNAQQMFQESMSDLKVEHLYGLLFHKIEDLKNQHIDSCLSIMREAREKGHISRIGVSIYNIDDLKLAISVFPDLDIIQLPANLVNMDLLESELIKELKNQGVEIHVRSVFLQGLLLLEPNLLPQYFEFLKPVLYQIQEIANQKEISTLQVLLGSLKFHPLVDVVILGTSNLRELDEITRAWANSEPVEQIKVPSISPDLLDPRNWPSLRNTA